MASLKQLTFALVILIISVFIVNAINLRSTHSSTYFQQYAPNYPVDTILTVGGSLADSKHVNINVLVKQLYNVLSIDVPDIAYIDQLELLKNIIRERTYDVKRAAVLAKQTIRMRKKILFPLVISNQYQPPCYLGDMIFQQGIDENQIPVIWIRLKQMGKSIRAINKVSRTEELSLSIAQGLAWYLNNWQTRYVQQQATLVLDFENTNEVMSTGVLTDFIMHVDETFPGLFHRIIHLRYKTLKISNPIDSISRLADRVVDSYVMSAVEKERKIFTAGNLQKFSSLVPIYIHHTRQWPLYLTNNCAAPHSFGTSCRKNYNSPEQMFITTLIQNQSCQPNRNPPPY